VQLSIPDSHPKVFPFTMFYKDDGRMISAQIIHLFSMNTGRVKTYFSILR